MALSRLRLLLSSSCSTFFVANSTTLAAKCFVWNFIEGNSWFATSDGIYRFCILPRSYNCPTVNKWVNEVNALRTHCTCHFGGGGELPSNMMTWFCAQFTAVCIRGVHLPTPFDCHDATPSPFFSPLPFPFAPPPSLPGSSGITLGKILELKMLV